MTATMDAVDTISDLLSRLSITENKTQTLEELKTLISVLPRRDLRDAIPNISIGNIFNCMNTPDKSQQTVCGEILNSMLSTLSASTILENFNSYLLSWLQLPHDSVKSLCLNQMSRLCQESPEDVCNQQPLLLSVVDHLSSKTIEVGLAAAKALTQLGKDSSGLQTLFSHPVVDQIGSCMQTNDTVRFRVYQMAIDICSSSPSALDACVNAGLLQQLINETLNDADILVQLNAIELVSDLARCPHGLSFLDRQGVVAKLETLMQGLDGNPMAGLLLPGLIKFYGGLARTHPKEVLSKFSRFVRLVFGSISDNNDPSLASISMDTVAFIASTPEGKLALDQLGNPMTDSVQSIGRAIRQGTSDAKNRALQTLASLLYLQTEHQTTELLALTERWFNASNTDPFKAVWAVAQQPFSDLRIPALRVLQSVAMVPWGQRVMNDAAGFKEYLLDRSTENTKEGKEEKFEVVKILSESPTCIDILGRPYHVKLKEYKNEGPFFVLAQSEVAMEGES